MTPSHQCIHPWSGDSVSTGGDFNGDGWSDILITAPHADHNSISDSGQIYVLFGTQNPSAIYGSSFNLSSLDGLNGFVINGIAANDNSGYSLSIAGDFNGDGFSNILIGTPNADVNALFDSGQAYILFGTQDPLAAYGISFSLSSLNESNGFSINGIAEDDRSGDSVSIGGDFNGDGYSDILIGAPQADPDGLFNSDRLTFYSVHRIHSLLMATLSVCLLLTDQMASP